MKTSLFPILGSMLLSTSTSVRCAPVSDVEKTWILHQNHLVQGMQTVYISPRGLRIDGKMTGLTILCCAPKWDVYIYDASRQVAYKTNSSWFMSEQIEKMRQSGLALPLNAPMTVQSTRCNFKGLICKLWRSSATDSTLKHRVDVIVTEQRLSSKQSAVLAKFYGLPEVAGIPVHARIKRESGTVKPVLDTTSAATRDLPKSLFELPKDCTLVSRDKF